MKFEVLFDRYFSNFPSLLLTNLIFFVPLAITVLAVYLFDFLTQGVLFYLLCVVVFSLCFGAYSGVVVNSRNLARGDNNISVFSTFIRGVRENFLRFTVYGLILSLAVIFSYYSIYLYSKMLSESWMFYAALFFCIVIALLVFFAFFYIPQMQVTFDLSLKHIIKNSLLMSFGEIKNNFFATLSLAVALAVFATLTIFCTSVPMLLVVLAVIFALFLPATMQFLVCFFTYDGMYELITSKSEKKDKIDNRISNVKNRRDIDYVEEVVEDYSDVDISQLKDCDDYIFYKGKMIKQSVLLKKALKYQESLEKNNDEEV